MRATILSGILASCLASTALSAPVPYHQRLSTPRGWSLGPVAPDTHLRTFTVALTQDDARMASFRTLASRIADPSDATHYRQFLTREQVSALTRARDGARDAVVNWVREGTFGEKCGLLEERSDSLVFRCSAAALRKLVGAQLRFFRHDASGRVAARTHGDAFVPESVRPHVAFFTGLFELPFVKERSNNNGNNSNGNNNGNNGNASGPRIDAVRDAGLDTYNAPYTYRNLYGIPETTAEAAGNSVGVIEFGEGAGFQKGDWQQFLSQVAGNDDASSVPYPTIQGPFTAKGDPNLDGECTLDIEMVSSLTTVKTYFITFADGWIYDMASSLATASDAPTIVSISYGFEERLTCEIVACTPNPNDPTDYIMRTEDELMKLSTLGFSVLASSGDTGANGGRSPQAQACEDSENPINPSYPASSAWITSVGATMIPGDSPAPQGTSPYCDDTTNRFTPCGAGTGNVETACSYPSAIITTGGGFSTVIPAPRYQAAAVASYLGNSSALPPSALFNASNRGFPDISAAGSRILVTDTNMGQPGIPATIPVAGTSASCPIAAALFSHVNAQAIQGDGKPLGFLNNLIYRMAAQNDAVGTFRDVVVGDNRATEQAVCQYGYYAAPGWDATTGVGSPLAPQIIQYIQNNVLRR